MGEALATLPGLHPPHPPRVPGKVDTLAQCYEDGDRVPPVVAIEFDGEAWALSGSHRIPALARCFESVDEAVSAGRLLVLDGAEILSEAREKEDADAIWWLMHRDRWSFFPEILGELWPYLGEAARMALHDEERTK